MLYRHKQGTFEVCPFKATYTVILKQTEQTGTETIELEYGTTEEIPIYETKEVEEQRESYVNNKELFERTLSNSNLPYKDLAYEEFSLTEEQQERYELIRFLPESSIGECIEYINGGVIPKDLELLQLGRELSEREINEVVMGQQISEMEIQLLELKLGGI